MLHVRRNRQFMCAGYYYTLWIECVGSAITEAGQLKGVDYGEFWQWLTDHVVTLPSDKGPPLTPQQGGKLQVLGQSLEQHPDQWSAELFASHLLPVLREISDMVASVTVLRSTAAGHADYTVECTARVRDCDIVTVGEAREWFARFAAANRLLYDKNSTGPREIVGPYDDRDD